MTDDNQESNNDAQKPPKIKVPEPPEKTLRRIFGTSQVFYSNDVMRPRMTGSTVPIKVKEYYHQGHNCLEHEDWEMAVLFFSRALHLDPTLGQCLYDLCDFQEALLVFLQASDLQPKNSSFSYRCIACLLALERHQDCLTLITREVKQGRASADIYILRARIYNVFQKPKLCYQDLRSALLLDPKHPEAKQLLQMMVGQAKQSLQDASILAVQGKLLRALKCITCAIEHNPLDPNLFLFRGTLYRRLQQFEPAVEDFLKSLDMVTDSRDNLVQQAQRQLLLTYNDFAVHCYTQGAYQEGVLLLNKAIRDEQKEKGLYINRGDCFFQLGNLCYAEADYKQALALSPQDEGANLRMGVLQEKMGFLEQKHRQFQTAEDHFSVAIKHNPEKAQYYLHRAKIRQLLQNLLGARQDVATVLLLNPNYPKMAPLISNLFPGMSVEDVLNSEVAQLAKLELSRMVGSGPKASHPQSIVVQRLMERQKARTLMETWVPEQPFPEIPQEEMAALYIVQGDKTQLKREDKEGTVSQKVTSLTDSYVDQVSSGSVFSVLSISTSGFEVSTSQEYRSTSNTALSKSSLVKPQFSQPRKKIEHRGLSRGSKATQAAEYLNRPSGQRCNSSKAEAPQGPKSKPRKTEAPQSPHSSTTEVTKVKKPSKTRAALSPRQRLRRSRAVGAQSLKPKAHGNSQKQTKRSSRTHLPQDSSESLTSTNESQDRPPERSKDDPSSWSESLATSSSKSGNLLEQNLQLSKSKVSQELEDAPAP